MAAEWDSDSLRVKLATSIAQKISDTIAIKESDKILDFGCGTGLVSFSLMQYAGEVVGLDNSEGMVEQFNQKAEEYNLQASARTFNFESDTIDDSNFNLSVAAMVFHHLPDPQVILKKLYDSLKSNGTIAIADLDKEDGSFHPADMKGIYHHGFNRSDMTDWLSKAGFKAVKTETVLDFERDGNQYSIFLATATVA